MYGMCMCSYVVCGSIIYPVNYFELTRVYVCGVGGYWVWWRRRRVIDKGGLGRVVASSSHVLVITQVKDGVEPLGVIGTGADQSYTLAWGCVYGGDEENPSVPSYA